MATTKAKKKDATKTAVKSADECTLFERFIRYVDAMNALQYVRTEAFVICGKKRYSRAAGIRPYDMMTYEYDIANDTYKNVSEDARNTAYITTPYDETGADDIAKLDDMFMNSVVAYMYRTDDKLMPTAFVKIKSESVNELDLKLALAGF